MKSEGLARLAVASWVVAALLTAAPLLAQPAGFKEAVNAQVAAARRVAPELGVEIVDLTSGETVYAYNPETPRIVASNTKLFTTAAALEHLGPGYFFETEVLIAGKVEGGTLVGPMAVVGGGDPNLSGRGYLGDSYGAFREWAHELRRWGIERVTGEVLLVHGLFDGLRVHPDWPRDQLTRWYEAPVAALSFNDNCVLVRVRPGPRPGMPAEVELEPPLDVFEVVSTATTTSKASAQSLRIDRGSGERANVIEVSGRIYRGADSYDKWIAVADPLEYFGAAMAAAFAEEGVSLDRRPRPVEGLPPVPWKRLLTHRSGLLDTLEVINKRSQNFYAESVLKLLGARYCARGSWPEGTRLVSEYLGAVGFEPGAFQLADGSGMSRGNRFTPRQVTRLLEYMYRHPWSQAYLRTLPHSGERDLSWEDRLADPPYRGNVLAKTGTLNGVSTLSGYAKARSGKLYAFSILCNKTSSNWRAKRAQDEIVKALIDQG